jgi:hypothetical protein
MGQPPVLTSPKQISTLPQRFACARLSRPCLPGSSPRLFRDAHHRGFWPKQLAVAWDRRPDHRTRRALLHLQYRCAPPCGPAMLVTQDPCTAARCLPRSQERIATRKGLCQRRREIASGPEQKSITATARRPPISGAFLLGHFSPQIRPRMERLAEAGVSGAWSG